MRARAMKHLPCLAATALAMIATPAQAQRDPADVLMPEDPRARAAQEEWGYSQAVIHGDTIYLSGIVAGQAPGEADPSAGFDRAFRAIESILKRAGASGWDDVIDLTTFHTDLPAQFDAFRAVKDKYVKAPFPAWTAIDVDRLVPDGGLVEIKVVARRGK